MASPSLHVYLHAAAMGDWWREVVSELYGQVEGSGLYDAAESLTLCIVGAGGRRYLPTCGRPKWDTIEHAGQIHDYEYPTLRHLWRKACKHPEARYLYLHTKGVSSPPAKEPGAFQGRRQRGYWRQMMAHHLVTRWREAVERLDTHDAAGVLLIQKPFPHPHYSGNFWWARGDHLAQLPEPAPHRFMHPRLWAELWLLNRPCRAAELYPHPPSLPKAFVTDQYRGHHGAPIAD